MRKGDERLFGAPQVERGLVFLHRVLEALDAAVDVRVEQREEPAEVIRVALVRRRRHQEVVVGHLGQRLAQAVGVGLAVVGRCAHLVGFVHDDEVPARPQQALAGILDQRDPGNGRNDLVAFLPRVLAIVGPQHVAADDVELLAELVGQLALPLERQVGRRDDQRAADQSPRFEFLQKEPGHNRLTGARIIGKLPAVGVVGGFFDERKGIRRAAYAASCRRYQ